MRNFVIEVEIYTSVSFFLGALNFKLKPLHSVGIC
jgi:hypothetical protein